MPAGQLAAPRATCTPSIILLERRNAWVDGALCAWIVRRLALALGHYMPTHQPILFLDARRAHATNCGFAACAEVQIWPVVVPARMTWLLQSADTHAFLACKICLQQLRHAARVRAADGDLPLAELLVIVFGASRRALEGREWSTAFDRDGYGVAQAGLSQRVLRELGAATPPTIAGTKPIHAQLQVCSARNKRPRAGVVWWALSQAGASADVAADAGAPAVGHVAGGAALGPRRSERLAAKRARLGGDAALTPATSSSAASAAVPLTADSVSASSSRSAQAVCDGNQIMTRSRTKSLRTS